MATNIHNTVELKMMSSEARFNIVEILNKEASRLYAELCEPMLKFFILVSRNEPDR